MLAMFWPGPGLFSPDAAVSVTSGESSFNGTTLYYRGVIGGVTVTVETSSVPEPDSLGLAGLGPLALTVLPRWQEK